MLFEHRETGEIVDITVMPAESPVWSRITRSDGTTEDIRTHDVWANWKQVSGQTVQLVGVAGIGSSGAGG